MASLSLKAGGGLTLRLDQRLGIQWQEADWFGPIRFSLHRGGTWLSPLENGSSLVAPVVRDGRDDLGSFREWSWPAQPIMASVRAYADEPLLIFRLEASTDLPSDVATENVAQPSVVWPECALAERVAGGLPEGTRSYAHQHSEFALPVFGDDCARGFFFAPHRPGVVSPFFLVAPDHRSLMLAPLDGFHEQLVAVPDSPDGRGALLRSGWHGDLAEVRAGFATETALWGGPDPRTLLSKWGALLLRRNSTRRPSRYADDLSGKLSYWTDNGAAYYYRTEPGCDYTETLERVVESADIPFATVQIDSWFYPHEQLRPVSPEGAPIVPPTGAMRWEPREDLFPEGFASLRQRLGGLPLAFHSRHFSRQSPYWEQYRAWFDGEYAHPQDPDFYQMLLGQAVSWGALVYEQDWMVESFFGIRDLRQAPGRVHAWQQAMNDAARELGMHLQWCMSTPADFMESVALTEVTSIRTSGDYKYMFDNGLNWVWFLQTNALARCLGLWPYKDVFVSYGPEAGPGGEPYREIEALLAALSAGPVGLGDALGRTDRDLVFRTCREDGVLVKPDVPIAALADCFRGNRFFEPLPLVGECYSDHPAGRWVYVTTFNANQRKEPITASVKLSALGESRPSGHVVAYDWRRRSWARLAPEQGWEIELAFQDWDFRVVCPELAGERTVFGDVSKYATVGDRRVSNIRNDAGRLSFEVKGKPGTTVSVHGWSANRPRAVSRWLPAGRESLTPGAAWQWSEADGGWVVTTAIGPGGFSVIDVVYE